MTSKVASLSYRPKPVPTEEPIACTAVVLEFLQAPSLFVVEPQQRRDRVRFHPPVHLVDGRCSVTLEDATMGKVTIQVQYNGDSNNLQSRTKDAVMKIE